MKRLSITALVCASYLLAVSLGAAHPPSATSKPHATQTTPSGSVPGGTLRQIKAEYGAYTYVPTALPRGYLFTSWDINPASFGYLLDRLTLTFARSGTRLVWTVSDGRDGDDFADCSRSPYHQIKRRIKGRVVYYARGNHGDSAWTCLRAPGGSFQVGIDLWIANLPGRPSPLTAMQMVAGAKRA